MSINSAAPALLVGIAFGLRQFIQQGLGIFGGAFVDRLGAKPMIIADILMCALGFVLMGIADELWLLWLFCALSALGVRYLIRPRSTALVIKLTRPWERERFYSLLMTQDSAGAVIGVLLGSWLLRYDFKLVYLAGAVLFVFAAIFDAWLLPGYRISTVRAPILEGMRRVLRDQRFVTYVLTLPGYYMLSVQVMLMLSIRVNEAAGQPAAVKWMDAIEAALSLLYPIALWSESASGWKPD